MRIPKVRILRLHVSISGSSNIFSRISHSFFAFITDDGEPVREPGGVDKVEIASAEEVEEKEAIREDGRAPVSRSRSAAERPAKSSTRPFRLPTVPARAVFDLHNIVTLCFGQNMILDRYICPLSICVSGVFSSFSALNLLWEFPVVPTDSVLNYIRSRFSESSKRNHTHTKKKDLNDYRNNQTAFLHCKLFI